MTQNKERYQVMHFMRTINSPMVRATAEKPNQAYEAGKFLQKEGAVQVQIHDAATGKIYDLPAFAKEHRLK